MKRIIVSVICVVMCCSFLCQYVGAEEIGVETSKFNITQVNITGLASAATAGETPIIDTLTKSTGTFSNGYWNFTGNWYHTVTSRYNSLILNYYGNWDKTLTESAQYLWLTVRIDVSQGVVIDFNKAVICPNLVQIISKSGSVGYQSTDFFALSEISSNEYWITYSLKLQDETFDFLNDTDYIIVYAPSADAANSNPTYSNFRISTDIILKYELTSTHFDKLIIGNLENQSDLLNQIINKQDLTIDEIIATREVIEANGEKLQEISNKQDTIITELEQLPDALRDLEVGDPYDKSIDTSEIVAYESAYNKVMDEVDVDQVVNIMDGGISLNQSGMYNDQSFNSVSDLMTNIIDATGLMPLITLTLTLGLACFIIGRSGKL